MSCRNRTLSVNLDVVMANDPLRELFEACKTGDIIKVKKLINSQTVNARDIAGRKSTPLHFGAGLYQIVLVSFLSFFFFFVVVFYSVHSIFITVAGHCYVHGYRNSNSVFRSIKCVVEGKKRVLTAAAMMTKIILKSTNKLIQFYERRNKRKTKNVFCVYTAQADVIITHR